MILSLDENNLIGYLLRQLGNFFPDGERNGELKEVISYSLEKVKYNFKYIKLDYFWKDGQVYFNHLNADQYTVFLYYCSNIAYQFGDITLASKLFYLNKLLHGFHCMYDHTTGHLVI